MPNLGALSGAQTAATALGNLILVSPQTVVGYQPQNGPSSLGEATAQAPSLLFNYEGEQIVAIQSDITDHYVENNSAVQDQIALKPIRFTTHGFIGELNNVTPPALALLKAAAEKLTTISGYVPVISETALIAYNEAFAAYQLAASLAVSAVSSWQSLSGTGGESVINGQGITTQSNQSKQQIYFQQFYGYQQSRTLFTVQTPWAIFQDMAIESLRAIQSGETNTVTDFEITFKQMRFSNVTESLNLGDTQTFEGRSAVQAGGLVDLGTSTPASSITVNDGLAQNYPGSFTAA